MLKVGAGAWASSDLGGVGANQTVAADGTDEGDMRKDEVAYLSN
jgi:hypothetical protein